ncbi:MAG: hypothetical protein K2H18_05850 [Muribaculaceae bacterium]|nr:hypothetical protein [Muribaculaceae bacterium]
MKRDLKIIILIVLGLSLTHADAIEIVDGWTWKYKDINYSGEYSYWFEYSFDGTEEINGKTYHVFRNTFADKKMLWDVETDEWRDFNIALSPPWFVRQEDNKFYVLFNPDNVWFNDDWAAMGYPPPSGEILLYDFNVSTGETYSCWEGETYTINANVNGEVSYKIGNSDLKCQEIEYSTIPLDHSGFTCQLNRIVSQEFGILKNGVLPIFIMGGISGSYDIDYGPGFFHLNLMLYSVTDEKGNEIYNPGYVSSFPDLINDSIHECNKTYDLYGREVKTILPGSVYIRNGKKFIGR